VILKTFWSKDLCWNCFCRKK